MGQTLSFDKVVLDTHEMDPFDIVSLGLDGWNIDDDADCEGGDPDNQNSNRFIDILSISTLSGLILGVLLGLLLAIIREVD